MADDMIQKNTTSAMASAVSDMSSGNQDAGTDPFASAKDELISRYELLPEDIKAAILDSGYQQKLFDLAKTEKLTYEELGVLEMETTMVLLGMTKPTEYRDELQRELKKNDTQIDFLVKAINEQVFAPIRSSLERVYSAHKDPMDYIKEDVLSEEPNKPAAAAPLAVPTPAVGTPVTLTRPSISAPAWTPPAAAPSVAKPMAFPSSLTSSEKSVLGAAGVVINQAPEPSAPARVSEIPDRANLLASIENPSKISSNIVADKLKTAGPVISATKTTDYSMPAKAVPTTPAAPVAPAKPYVDPYREPI